MVLVGVVEASFLGAGLAAIFLDAVLEVLAACVLGIAGAGDSLATAVVVGVSAVVVEVGGTPWMIPAAAKRCTAAKAQWSRGTSRKKGVVGMSAEVVGDEGGVAGAGSV